jgi:hypothetical protein
MFMHVATSYQTFGQLIWPFMVLHGSKIYKIIDHKIFLVHNELACMHLQEFIDNEYDVTILFQPA